MTEKLHFKLYLILMNLQVKCHMGLLGKATRGFHLWEVCYCREDGESGWEEGERQLEGAPKLFSHEH